jgi:hypothetical protein
MIVFLDRQHVGKPNNIHDRGASLDPVPSFGLGLEAIYTGYLSLIIESRLISQGVKVMPLSDGRYPERHKRVNEYARHFQEKQVYISLHLNAGGGDYCSMFYHHQSTQGALLAESICERMKTIKDQFPKIKRCLPKKASPEDWTRNAYNTIKGVGSPIAICAEPLFIDTHREYLSHPQLEVIGDMIASGIIDWSQDD